MALRPWECEYTSTRVPNKVSRGHSSLMPPSRPIHPHHKLLTNRRMLPPLRRLAPLLSPHHPSHPQTPYTNSNRGGRSSHSDRSGPKGQLMGPPIRIGFDGGLMDMGFEPTTTQCVPHPAQTPLLGLSAFRDRGSHPRLRPQVAHRDRPRGQVSSPVLSLC